ncbi:LPS assembly lipoprotein LptE [Variovorax sp. HJSM1_2]
MAVAAAAAGLSACGFKLRQAPDYVFNTIYVQAAESSSLANELKRTIAAGGKVTVRNDALGLTQADVVLVVILDQRVKSVATRSSAGQVQEFTLTSRFKFRLRTPAGEELIPDSEIVQRREISYSETEALGKDAEEALLYRNMQTDIVQQVMRRLASVKEI